VALVTGPPKLPTTPEEEGEFMHRRMRRRSAWLVDIAKKADKA
jgi:hypothetical protein